MFVRVDFVEEGHAQPEARLDHHQTLVSLHIQRKRLTQRYYAVNGVQEVNGIVNYGQNQNCLLNTPPRSENSLP